MLNDKKDHLSITVQQYEIISSPCESISQSI